MKKEKSAAKVPSAKASAKSSVAPVVKVKVSRVPVSELNVVKTAARLMTTKLVSTEIAYVQRVLGASATQDQLDEKVLAVRRMPWSSIAIPD
jgi:hypothetical protein